jgi:transcriptional regulator with XRE-family HTH domain
MTDSFSTWLRKERERQNISIAAIAASTKIKASLFEGLERGDVSQWPAGIYRRSFVKAYAEAIKLDPEIVCRKFAEQFPDAGEVARQAAEAALEAAAAPSQAAATPADDPRQSSFRLTLADAAGPFRGSQLLIRRDQRLKAIAWDAGSLLAIATSAFIVLGAFWMPLAIITMAYYLGGILVLGNSPGVCIFAPKPPDERATRPVPGQRSAERRPAPPFEPPMHPLDVVSPDQLIGSPGPRVHPHPALHERIELERPRARA